MPALTAVPTEIRVEIETTQKQLRSLQGRWPAELSFTNFISKPSVYDCFPYLFFAAFPGTENGRVRELAFAGRLLANSLFLYDALADRTEVSLITAPNVLRAQAFQFEAYQVLHGLFPPDSRFWERLRACLVELAETAVLEERIRGEGPPWTELNEELAHRMAKGKSAVAKAAIAGLAALAGDDGPVERLTRSIDEYAVARQMFDDLCDWKEDLAHNLPSLVLARTLAEGGSLGIEPSAAGAKRVTEALYYDGHAIYVIKIALDALDRAALLVEGFTSLAWLKVIEQLRASCQSLLSDIERITSENQEHLRCQGSSI